MSQRTHTIVALLILILAVVVLLGGAGAAYTVAMAVVTIGGVLGAGVLSLFLIPVVYTWFERDRRSKTEPAQV